MSGVHAIWNAVDLSASRRMARLDLDTLAGHLR
jgi:hypothetical protein